VAEKTIFKKIIDGEIPAEIVHDDDRCLAFKDINPQAPTHVLVIPKKEIASLDDLTAEDEGLVGHLIMVATQVAGQADLAGGYRLGIGAALPRS